MAINFNQIKEEHFAAIESVIAQSDKIEASIYLLVTSLKTGGKVLWCGNGGSAADAQHMAAELMVRYVKNRKPLASIALTTDTSLITAHSNDFEYETLFERQVEALAKSGDVLIAISTSGNSQNVTLAAKQAKKMGVKVVVVTGNKTSQLTELADVCLFVQAEQTARIQEGHILIGHLLCEGLDEHFE